MTGVPATAARIFGRSAQGENGGEGHGPSLGGAKPRDRVGRAAVERARQGRHRGKELSQELSIFFDG